MTTPCGTGRPSPPRPRAACSWRRPSAAPATEKVQVSGLRTTFNARAAELCQPLVRDERSLLAPFSDPLEAASTLRGSHRWWKRTRLQGGRAWRDRHTSTERVRGDGPTDALVAGRWDCCAWWR